MSDKNKAVPHQGNSPSQNNNTILSYAEYETLRLLIEHPMDRFRLGYKIHSGYAPNEVKGLRGEIGYDALETVYQPYERRDGKTTRIGIYTIRDMKRAIELFRDSSK